MSRLTAPLALALVLAAQSLAAQQESRTHKQPTPEQCRSAVEAMMQEIRKTTREARDKRADEFLAKVEKQVAENRTKGKGECETWNYIMDAATRQ